MSLRLHLRTGILICALIMVPLIPTGTALARRNCRERIHQEEERLDRAVRRHGEHSRQAEKERHKLDRLREECRRERR